MSFIERTVLNQRVLHQSEQRAAIGRDRQAFHPAIGLASHRVVGRQFKSGSADERGDLILLRHI